MDKNEICRRLDAVCQVLDNTSVSGIQNVSNIAGSYRILQEIIYALQNPMPNQETEKKEEPDK